MFNEKYAEEEKKKVQQKIEKLEEIRVILKKFINKNEYVIFKSVNNMFKNRSVNENRQITNIIKKVANSRNYKPSISDQKLLEDVHYLLN